MYKIGQQNCKKTRLSGSVSLFKGMPVTGKCEPGVSPCRKAVDYLL